MTQAAPATLDQVPADAVAVVAAFADFFDRAKLAVCGKIISGGLEIIFRIHSMLSIQGQTCAWAPCLRGVDPARGTARGICMRLTTAETSLYLTLDLTTTRTWIDRVFTF